MSDITKTDILKALKNISDPGIDTASLTLNSIKRMGIDNNKLTLDLALPLPSIDVDSAEKRIIDQLKSEHNFISEVDLNLLLKSPNVAIPPEPPKEALLKGVKNTIAVASGKGGVGKSTVAVNLAVALAKDGAKVGLIDADIYGPSIPLMLGISQKPQIKQVGGSMKLIPIEAYGIKMISIGLLIDDSAPVIWRGPMASGAIKQFMTDVVWDELDYLIFDLPPGTGDIQLTLVQTIPLTGAVIVTTPQEVSLIDARKALKMFERVNVPVLGIIENMSYFIAPDTGNRYDIFGSGGGEKTAQELQISFLGGIPIDQRIRVGGDNGIPMVSGMPDSENTEIILNISRNLTDQVNKRNSASPDKVEIILEDED
ncbi:MAG: Mrp/NBP35 family ATP-binding protein [Ignavibacteria bacterium]|nr:Mrp/NBP35 family ATP-binding protein [Ignavibacteria bacterium]